MLTLVCSILLAGTAVAVGDEDALILNQIAAHRQWTKMNAEPLKLAVIPNQDAI